MAEYRNPGAGNTAPGPRTPLNGVPVSPWRHASVRFDKQHEVESRDDRSQTAAAETIAQREPTTD